MEKLLRSYTRHKLRGSADLSLNGAVVQAAERSSGSVGGLAQTLPTPV